MRKNTLLYFLKQVKVAPHIGDFQLIMEHAFEASDMNMNGGLEITDLYLLVYQIIGIIGN